VQFCNPMVPMCRSLLISIGLAALLCACGMRTNLQIGALPCPTLLIATGLLDETPGALPPSDDSGGGWVTFGDRQTGQLDKSNADKRGSRRFLEECKRLQDEANPAAKRRTRFLGIF